MLSYNPSEADITIVKVERKTEKNKLIRTRMDVLYLLSLGYSRSECARIAGCHQNSVSNYIKMYNEGGLDLVRQLNYPSSTHELDQDFEKVEQVLEQANFSTVSDAQELLKKEFGYHRKIEAVRRLLHRLGFKRRKTGTFPGKIKDFEKWQAQQEVFSKKLEGLINQAKIGDIDLVFSDAAHFVYGKYSSYQWSKEPKYAASGHGRYRINVYGSYDVISNQVFSMYNEGYIDAEFIVEYLEWLRSDIYTDKKRPLHLVLDNARYQHCNYVKQRAKKLNVVLEFLPSYSPNLNLIERLWRYLKKIIGRQYHDGKIAFQEAIVSLLGDLGNEEHQSKIWVLLNPKFQHFEKSQILKR